MFIPDEWAAVVAQCSKDAATVEICADEATQREIDQLMQNVPQLGEHFEVLNRIGSGMESFTISICPYLSLSLFVFIS